MKNTALVVPSIRKDSFERFVREWRRTGLFERVDLFLIEDNPRKTFDTPDEALGRHYSWTEIDSWDWSWIIPRRSDTIRSFGYWRAWKCGYEFLMTLDDDCYPAQDYEQLDILHKEMLHRTKWFNTLNSVRPRGVPYRNLGSRVVHVNHGIWQGVLDYDAPQQLVDPAPETYTHDNRIVPHGAYHPFCGMNAMWRREAIPLSYHLLMGQMAGRGPQFGMLPEYKSPSVEPGSLDRLPFDRMGDIWCGIIQKRICDHLGWVVSTGTPYVHHDRASDPFKNLRKEANGIEVNEDLWERIDAVVLPDRAVLDGSESPAAYCYAIIAGAISEWGGEHSDYWRTLGRAMAKWSDLF